MFVPEPISLSPLNSSIDHEAKSKTREKYKPAQKNCRLCKTKWISIVEFLFCEKELQFSHIKPSKARAIADKCKSQLVDYYEQLIPAIAHAMHNNRPHDAHKMRLDFETIFMNAVKEEASARLNGSHRPTVSIQRVYPPNQIKRMTNYSIALWTTTVNWLRAVDTGGYALYLRHKNRFDYSLVDEMQQIAEKHEKEAQQCEDALINGLRVEVEPEGKQKEQKAKKSALRVKKVNNTKRAGFLCCFCDVNVSREEAEIIKRNLDL